MKKSILTALALIAGSSAQAATINTADWTFESAPSAPGHIFTSTDHWQSENDDSAYVGNGFGALVSDFTVDGDYIYSGAITPTADPNGFLDDDLLGVVFGWQDTENHLRLGFEGGGSYDRGNISVFANGFWIAQEIDGVSTKLYEQTDFTFALETSYDFSISVLGGDLSFSFNETGKGTLYEGSLATSAPLGGKVGIFTESQAATFNDLTVDEFLSVPPSIVPVSVPQPDPQPEISPVPLPAGFPLVLAGLGALGLLRRLKR